METSEYIEDDLDALLEEDEVIEDHGDEATEDEDSERNDNELLLAHLLGDTSLPSPGAAPQAV